MLAAQLYMVIELPSIVQIVILFSKNRLFQFFKNLYLSFPEKPKYLVNV